MQDILNFLATHLTSENLLIIAFLVIIEGALSFDNAIGLAAIVRARLDEPAQQKKALQYGILVAYIFRTLMLFFGLQLIKYLWVQVLAAAYLIWLGVVELWPKFNKKEEQLGKEESKERTGIFKFLSPFAGVVMTVSMMDMVFAVDSILVAFAITNVLWLLLIGVFIGILMMRFAAVVFVSLIGKYPILEKIAFVLIIIAGISMLLKTTGIHIPEIPMIIVLFSVIVISVGINHLYPKQVKELLDKYY